MVVRAELLSLPLAQRIELVGAIWDSIAADQKLMSDRPEVLKEVRERMARHQANPKAAIPLEEVLKRVASSRG
jgi:putative addiction module component (TIGR02574 family)